MNEDIKIVKNLLQMLENGFLTEEMCPIPSWNPEQNYASALAHILSDYEANKIKVQELEEENYIQRKQLNDAFVRGFIHKDKIESELNLHLYYLSNQAITSNPTLDRHFRDKEKYVVQVLQKILKGEK